MKLNCVAKRQTLTLTTDSGDVECFIASSTIADELKLNDMQTGISDELPDNIRYVKLISARIVNAIKRVDTGENLWTDITQVEDLPSDVVGALLGAMNDINPIGGDETLADKKK